MKESSERGETFRILAKGVTVSNDTWRTGLNNNDLIIGPSGAGKTRGYVIPNLLESSGSLIVTDTKGSLAGTVGPLLAQQGCRVLKIDFEDLEGSYGYNPLDHIRYDERRGKYAEQDIITAAAALVPVTSRREPFWEEAARLYLTSLIAYVLECLPAGEHSLKYVVDLIGEMESGVYDRLIRELAHIRPNSLAVQTYRLFQSNHTAEKMHASIIGILSEKLNGLNFDGAVHMFTRPERVQFAGLGRERTVLFLTVSDTDRSMDRLVNLLYTQALQALCRSADTDYPDHRLPVPVRFILDDFATNACIPDFHNIISVIRSREISVSIILQSLSQLEAMYGEANASTIINNCDNCLYLGGQDVATARYVSFRANRTVDTVLGLPLHEAYLFTRGQAPRSVHVYDLREHPRYAQLCGGQKARPRTLPDPARPAQAGEGAAAARRPESGSGSKNHRFGPAADADRRRPGLRAAGMCAILVPGILTGKEDCYGMEKSAF